MRQEKTLKIRANHMVLPTSELQEHAGSAKAWVYRTLDFADGELKAEMLCIRFGNEERAAAFKEAFEAGAEVNKGLMGGAKGEDGAEEKEEKEDASDALADKLEGAKVE